MSGETYQVGTHFKALNEAVLTANSKILDKFFPFRVSQPPCASSLSKLVVAMKIIVNTALKNDIAHV